jgi:thioester reductase-like protein
MSATSHSEPPVLITGATGFIGLQVLARILERSHRPVIALVRAANAAHATQRIEAALTEVYGEDGRTRAQRVMAVPADLTLPRLGLADHTWRALGEQAGDIVHAGASISFTTSVEQARASNVEGTRAVIALARRAHAAGGLRRVVHFSTAYVAGEHPGLFTEQDRDVGQSFRNPYERSKLEAEQLLADDAGDLPITVLRPSIVVGERASGWTNAFNVLYWPLRAFARGLLPALPAALEGRVDIVPVDYVADAAFALLQAPSADETYHLTAGREASTVGELISLTCQAMDRPPPAIVDHARFAHLLRSASITRLQRAALEQTAVLFPYFAAAVKFDDSRTRRALYPHGVRPSRVSEYLDVLLAYAQRARWGKRPESRERARELASQRSCG